MNKKEPTFEELLKANPDGLVHPQDHAEQAKPIPKRKQQKPRRLTKPLAQSPQKSSPDCYRHTGLQHSTYQRLKRGKISIEETLDLHTRRVHEVSSILDEFMRACLNDGLRCVLVICGKGLHSQEGKPILRDIVRTWLRDCEYVLAYCPAVRQDGGDGAIYILLKTL